MPTPIEDCSELKPGDFFEDCAYHPCLCFSIGPGTVQGISLVDGSFPRDCMRRTSDREIVQFFDRLDRCHPLRAWRPLRDIQCLEGVRGTGVVSRKARKGRHGNAFEVELFAGDYRLTFVGNELEEAKVRCHSRSLIQAGRPPVSMFP